jgi:uncharacterized protein YycO
MRILLFKGKGVISRSIRWQTRGKYSHAAVLLNDDKTIIEAWHTGTGVRKKEVKDWSNIDVYYVPGLTKAEAANVLAFLEAQIGKGYDYFGVLRFLSRRNRDNPNRWFCSELVVAAFRHAGVQLFHPQVPAWKISPETLSWSPLLFEGVV